jgi:YVTN family beta-propeller protein
MKGSTSSWCVAFVALAISGVAATAHAQPYVYVLGRTSATPSRNVLTVINGATNTKGPSVSLGTSNRFVLPQAMAIAPDGDRIYVINDLDSTISVVSTATNTVVDTWPSSLVGTNPRALTVSPDSQRVYVVGNNQLFIAINVASKSRVATVTHNLGGSFGVAASPDGTRVYMMATGSDRLAVLSTAPFAVIATLPLDLDVRFLRGDTVALSPDGRFVYLPQSSTLVDTCGGDPNCIPLSPPGGAQPTRVSVVDTTTNAIVATTNIAPFYTKAYQAAVSPNGATVYAPAYGGDGVRRLSPTTHAILGSTPLELGRAVTFSANSSRGYVATDVSVAVFDTATHAILATIPFTFAVDGRPNALVATPPPPPAAPSNLRATITGNRVSLAWDPSPSDGVSGYAVEGGTTPSSVLATLPTGSTAPAFTFDAPSGAFYVRVRAVSGGQRSQPSNEIYILVNVPQPPSAPTGLLGLANGSNLALSWRAASGGGTPTSFILDVSGSLAVSVAVAPGETFQYVGVPDGTYTFTVRAVNGTGTSAASSPVTLTFPSACPGPPQAPTSLAVTKTGTQLSVSWEPPSAGPAVTSYLLRVTGTMNLSLPVSGRSIAGGVPPGVYNLSVMTVNPCGVGAETPVQSVTVP